MNQHERALLVAIGDAVARLLYAETYPGNADHRDAIRTAMAEMAASAPQSDKVLAHFREALEVIASCPPDAVHLMPMAAQAALSGVPSAPQTGSTEGVHPFEQALLNIIASCGGTEASAIAGAALSTASAPPQGWQPIATAPKDGTWFLGWLKSPLSHAVLIHWLADASGTDGVSYGLSDYWQVMGDLTPSIEMVTDRLTYWMPLPAPPASPSEEREP